MEVVGIEEHLLRRIVKRFRGGLVLKAHGVLYHSRVGSRVIKKMKSVDNLPALFRNAPLDQRDDDHVPRVFRGLERDSHTNLERRLQKLGFRVRVIPQQQQHGNLYNCV